MTQEPRDIQGEIVDAVLFFHEENRQEVFKLVCFSVVYMAMIGYKQDCQILLMNGVKLDQEKVNGHWNDFVLNINLLMTNVGVEVFQANKIQTAGKGDNYEAIR